ncbi:ribonuclease P [compost metagenome]
MLTIHHRFHGHGSLRYVYKNGEAIRSRLMTLKYIVNPHRGHSRFAVVISKKVLKSAVRRNRVRRRVYEVIRLELPKLRPAHDMALMIFNSEVESMPSDELTMLIRQLFEQADIYEK